MKTSDFWNLSKAAAKRAIEQEAVDNLAFAVVERLEEKQFFVHYGFYTEPSEDDLEALSLMETEMYAASWQWVEKISYDWEVKSEPKSFDEHANATMIYKGNFQA